MSPASALHMRYRQSVEQGTGLVANIKPNIPWVRLAQRVPVRIALLPAILLMLRPPALCFRPARDADNACEPCRGAPSTG